MSYASLLGEALRNWECQELAGNLVDTVAGTPMVPNGAPVYGAGGPTAWLPKAVQMAPGSHFTAGNVAALNLLPSFTYFCWVRPNLAGNQMTCINNTQLQLLVSAGGAAFAFTGNVYVAPGLLFLDADWNWFAFTRTDANNGTVYLNGGSLAVVMAGEIINQNLFAIGHDGGFNNPLTGRMAGVTVWGRDLSAGELATWVLGPAGAVARRRRGSGKTRMIR